MEKTKNHKLICDSRKLLQLTGVEKVESSNETQVLCLVMGAPLLITGKGMHMKKLDVEQGLVEIEGQIDGIRYQAEHRNLLKRMFK